MPGELWELLRADEIPEHELSALLSEYFPSGLLEAGADVAEYAKGQEEEAALRLRYQDGVLVDVEPGPALDPTDAEALRSLVEDHLRCHEQTSVARAVFFSRVPV